MRRGLVMRRFEIGENPTADLLLWFARGYTAGHSVTRGKQVMVVHEELRPKQSLAVYFIALVTSFMG